MAKNLTDSETYTTPVAVPTDGDVLQAVTVEVGFQALANRTAYLKAADDRRVEVPFSVNAATYSGLTYDPSTEAAAQLTVTMSDDGLALYVLDDTNDTSYQYTLSTAWDISTASYASKSLDNSSQTTSSYYAVFGDSGSKYYVGRAGGTGDIYQYDLSTAWDLSTGAYASKTITTSSEDLAPEGIAFKSDGTKMYMVGSSGDAIYQYSLSTAWDISTATYDTVSLSVSGSTTTPKGPAFSDDGRYFYITDGNGLVYEYRLPTVWVLTSGAATGRTYDGGYFLNAQDYGPSFAPGGLVMLFSDPTDTTIHQIYTSYTGVV